MFRSSVMLPQGEPLFAEENIEDYFPIPAEMVPNSEVFMLHVPCMKV